MSVNNIKDYDEKVKRVNVALDLKTPDRVPVFIQNITWGFSYGKTKLADVLHEPRKLSEACISFCEDIYVDSLFAASPSAPLLIYEVLKPTVPQYRITEDGYAFEHFECADMKPQEYPQLIENPRKYIENVIALRRYPVLNEPYPKNYEALKKAYDASMEYLNNLVYGAQVAKEKYGVPCLITGAVFAPMDLFFDFFRGFQGTLTDMRRCPENVVNACNALLDYEVDLKLSNVKKGEVLFFPLHLATYMSVKQFEKFYWPTFKKIIDICIKKGAKPNIYLEGDWTKYIHFLKEFPKGSIIITPEYFDFKALKKGYGDHMAIVGGMPCDKLKYGTKEECVNYTKELLDYMAPGGGYMFTTDKALLSSGDVNVENFKAVIETVREYGKY